MADLALDQFAPRPLPITPDEVRARGWDEVDVVFVTGDAYIDHPSFAMALLGRVLEKHGFRVAILSQPDWHSCRPWRTFGRPRLFFAISAGNMDSMINHYTANRKVRNDDAYSPGGRIGLRPDRATLPYSHRAKEAYPDVPIIIGGVEASLRRLAHYDYWSDKVRHSILLDAKADLLAYGMGEAVIIEIAQRLAAEETPRDLRDMRGVAFRLGASETAPSGKDIVALPSYGEVASDRLKFAEATRRYHLETNPYNARVIVQPHNGQAVVVNPPRLPESEDKIDSYFELPYTRRPHPSYTEPIPAFEVIKDSLTMMRGCFGGCTFCSITLHQGRAIQSRSKESILREVHTMAQDKDFKGVISDLGGPTANMYKMVCGRPEIEAICRRLSCVHPTICPLLVTDHGPLIEVMRETRQQKGVKKVMVASGIRMDLASRDPAYMKELVQHHVGGHLKVAPEHTDATTLNLMKKPKHDTYESFTDQFEKLSKEAGKEQYLVPYFIGSHPGSTVESMIELAIFLKQRDYRPDQVQDFIPAPMDIATCMYYTGLDPMTGQETYVAKHLRDRKLQRAMLQFFKPENYFMVRRILERHGRRDLIGDGCNGLIPARPPKAALEAKRPRRNRQGGEPPGAPRTEKKKSRLAARGQKVGPAGEGRKAASVGTVTEDDRKRGYRPYRKSATRRERS